MKTLIIHHDDQSTDFLKGLYLDLPNKTVITGGTTKNDLLKHIENHDRTICCGHGSPMGLLSIGQFLDCGSYIIDDSMVESIISTNERYPKINKKTSVKHWFSIGCGDRITR